MEGVGLGLRLELRVTLGLELGLERGQEEAWDRPREIGEIGEVMRDKARLGAIRRDGREISPRPQARARGARPPPWDRIAGRAARSKKANK